MSKDKRLRLPPLNAIKAFEAAGRHRNFSKAAQELNVTPGAVSRQIKLLEDFLGLSLFVRTPTEVVLTRHGALYLRSMQEALSIVDNGTQEIIVQTNKEPLRIWGSRFFIQLWLMPRIKDFKAAYKDQSIEITSLVSNEPMPPEVDIGFKFGNGHWPGLRAHFLVQRHLMPVCSPRYLEESGFRLETPTDLQKHTLIHSIVGKNDWQQWYEASGAAPIELSRDVVCTSADVAYQGALNGLGIALGRVGFIETDIASGQLVAPFDRSFAPPGGFYLVYHDREQLPSRLLQFRRWILEEIQAMPVR